MTGDNMENRIRIFAFAGSLRRSSFNKILMRTASELCPEGATMETFDLEGIPLFNQEYESHPPARVAEFKNGILGTDALLIATPEYNFGIPGVLKNALDWASRPYAENVFADKPVAIMGASTGQMGTSRAQYQLRQCCVYLNMHPVNKPEVTVPYFQEKIDNEGKIRDEFTLSKIRQLMSALVEWTRKLQCCKADEDEEELHH